MDALAARRNVNERLADAEEVTAALLARCDALLMAGKALSDRVQACENELAVMTQRLEMFRQHYIGFRSQQVTFLQRLRWILRG